MELIDNEDVETMVTLYCGNRSNQNAPIQLFAELAGVEPIEDLTLLVDSQSNVRGIDVALETDMVGDDIYNSSDPSDHEVDSDSDLNVEEVPDSIDNEGVNDD
ncbi:hypothetical protein GOBAR_AA25813 [Gossypium barbadense]|uniref:Uncharacterized protein n=1 Tax=Gossypium barbadense TaxID=3634 RepID=A0A2P5WUT9_GOSBA|nr:hypothetical protein GOBAR_AA25813 [Gossypium barbadense]